MDLIYISNGDRVLFQCVVPILTITPTRVFISHFSVEPAFAGQVAKPTAAITMKPADELPLKVKLVRPFVGMQPR